MNCSDCGKPTDRIVDGKALCVFCEDGVENPLTERPAPPSRLNVQIPILPKDNKMKIRKAQPGEPACACGNVLRSDNRSGVCAACKKAGKKTAVAESNHRTPPRKLNSTPRLLQPERRNGHGAQIALTEPIVDRLISSFSFEQRLAMLRSFLEA
jgi:hypothetical protein